jgi:antirestriction protein
MSQAEETLEPRIYVACLAAYTSGLLHGAWIAVGDDAEGLRDQITAVLAASPVADAEEYAIHDHDGFGGISIGEHANLDQLVEIAGFLARAGPARSLGPGTGLG